MNFSYRACVSVLYVNYRITMYLLIQLNVYCDGVKYFYQCIRLNS